MNMSTPIPPLLRVPPPLLFVATFFGGLGLQHLAPLRIHSAMFLGASHAVGLGLAASGLLLALSCLALFLAARTTVIPFGSAARLITDGPYRFTRNPMYVSLVLVYVGAAGIFAQPWSLALLPLPVVIVHTIVIPFEEARLRASFGEAFERYCLGVRRWL